MEDGRGSGLGDDCLGSTSGEAGETDAHLVLCEAFPVPVAEVALGGSEYFDERAGKAHVEGAPGKAESGDDVAGESIRRRGGSLGYDVQLCTVVGGPFAEENPGIGTSVNRFVIDNRELANLEKNMEG